MALPKDWGEDQKARLAARIVSGALSIKGACETYGLSVEQVAEWVELYRRNARDALDDRITQILQREGIAAGVLKTAEFSGGLGDISVGDLLQTIELGRKDAVVTVTHHGRESRIWCVAGQVADAESGNLRGMLAACRILGIEQGMLSARFQPVTRAKIIDVPVQALLLEAARRKDECDALRQRLGDDDLLYAPSSLAASEQGTLTPSDISMLRRFEGARTADQVVSSGTSGDLEALKRITQLYERELLAQSGRAASEQRPSGRAPRVTGALASIPAASGGVGAVSEYVVTGHGAKRRAQLILGVLAGLVLGVGAWWLSSPGETGAPASISETQPGASMAGSARVEPLYGAPFVVDLRVQPREAEIWLDGRQVARGQFTVELPRDGRTHEIRLLADGYLPERLVFVDASPPREIELRLDQSASAEAAPRPRRASPTSRDVPKRPEGASGSSARSTPLSSPSAPAAAPAAPAMPSVKIIEDDGPKVRVVE